MKHILCYGDSNTWGQNSELPFRYPFDVRWTGRLSRLLPSQYRIIEAGLCGRTTAYELELEYGRNGWKTYPIALSAADPLDLVILMLGTNDRRPHLRVSPEESTLALRKFIDLTRTPEHWFGHQTPDILLISPPEIDPGVLETPCGFYYDQTAIADSKRLKQLYRTLAEETGCHFFDAASCARTGSDCVHMSADSHRTLAAALAPVIRSILN